ncbi:MAG: hypothetical protein AAGA84_08335 [Pseudomonadota bacterium]
MRRLLLLVCCTACLLLNTRAAADSCAAAGTDGTATLTGVVNTYYPGTNNPSVGDIGFVLGPARGLTPISSGDLVLIMQVQDARIRSTNNSRYGDNQPGDPGSGYRAIRNSGRYQFARATSDVPLGGGILTISQPIQFDLTERAASGAWGQRTFQVIRVPQLVDGTIVGTVTALPWDGNSGGIVAIDAINTLTFSGGQIDVSGMGFRGGGGRGSTSGSGVFTDYVTSSTNLANGSKGEGVAGTPRFVWNGSSVTTNTSEGYPGGSFARGAPGNAGGGGTDGRPSANDRNTGGGGGAGFGDGGRGGHAWCPGGPAVCEQSGGFGGVGVSGQGVQRLLFGGGGGAGTTNNRTGSPGNGLASSGETGGGIVIVRADTIAGSGSIRADGNDANQTVGNDGSGGAGAGGAIAVLANNASASLTLSASGGLGGTNGRSTPHGPGGGGGGGFIARSAALAGALTNVGGGQPGTTDGNPAPFNSNYGATAGSAGAVVTLAPGDPLGTRPSTECTLNLTKRFTPAAAGVGIAVRLEIDIANPNTLFSATSVTLSDLYPTGVVNAPVTNATSTCGGSISAIGAGDTLSVSGASISAQSTCTIAADVVATSGGIFDNVIAVGDATAAINGEGIINALATTATLTATEPLNVTKTVAVISDPINGTSANSYAIPGAIVEYTIQVVNPAGIAIDTDGIVITDLIPDDVSFVNTPIANGLPVALDDGSPSSTLTLLADDLNYSDDDGGSFAYTPAAGADAGVDGIRVSPSGSMPAGSSFAVRFRVLVQ